MPPTWAVALGSIGDVFAIGARGVDDLIVDIGDVTGVDNLGFAIAMAQEAEQLVKDDDGSCVADMGKAVNGWPANVEADAFRIDRLECLFPAGERIVEDERHKTSNSATRMKPRL